VPAGVLLPIGARRFHGGDASILICGSRCGYTRASQGMSSNIMGLRYGLADRISAQLPESVRCPSPSAARTAVRRLVGTRCLAVGRIEL
jgi:hypothetical protein